MTAAASDRIPFTRLYERTSARGNRYLLGRLGYARLIAFQGEPTAEGTPTWDVYITPGDPDGARRAPQARAEAPDDQLSTRPTPNRAPTPARAPRRGIPAPVGAADGDDDPEPFNDEIPF
jgi:hypothetical protein